MTSMYAKLFSRIAQSSLMEQDVPVRYCFMMLLAIADPVGDVIGTDIAIARTLNLPLADFKRCIAALMEPDPDSNSQVHDGRRIVASDSGRGYHLVNYVTYREIKTVEEKRVYMREYMRARREALKTKDVTAVKKCKIVLGDVTQEEGEGEGEGEGEVKAEAEVPKPQIPKHLAPPAWNPSPEQLEIGSWFNRRPTTPWSAKEHRALIAIPIDSIPEGIEVLAAPYRAKEKYTRQDLLTLLNNWQGEIDRWRSYKPAVCSDVKPAQTDYEDPPFLSNDDAIFHKSQP